MEAAEIDGELDRLVGPHRGGGLEPRDDGGARTARVALDRGDVLGRLHVDDSFEDVLDEDGLRLDVDVGEHLGAERLDPLHTTPEAPAVAVPRARLVERLRADA